MVAAQTSGEQSTVCTTGQVPLPSQVAASVAMAFVQLAARQEVTGKVQAVLFSPSQVPAHGVPLPTHATRGRRGVPVTAVHWPFVPGSAHASQAPLQALSQQTPSTQC